MTHPHSRYRVAKNILLCWCLFIGLGAVSGAAGFFAAPDGSVLQMQPYLPYFQVLPFSEILFQDYVFSGIALLLVNGVPNLIASALLFARKRAGIILGGVLGITLMLWITIQFLIFPFNFLSTTYFVFGIAQAATGWAAYVFMIQESVRFDEKKYPNIGKNPGEWVAYFSRMGYTKQLAYEIANQSGANVYEIRTSEPTSGTSGFWWCGRFAMHKWDMPIDAIPIDWPTVDSLTVVSPVWVFSVCAPVRAFLRASAGKARVVRYVLTHFGRARYRRVFDEMDALTGVKRASAKSVQCRMGRFREL